MREIFFVSLNAGSVDCTAVRWKATSASAGEAFICETGLAARRLGRLVVVRRFANRCAPFERSGFAGAVTSKCSVMNGAWMVTEPAISRFVAQATNDGAGFNASVALPHSELLLVRRGDVVCRSVSRVLLGIA